MTTEEARKYVDELVKQAQQQTVAANESNIPHEPRRIEIIEDEEDTKAANPKVDELRQQAGTSSGRITETATGLKPRF
jgi:polyhydroxyalkanoate synthesis regulator phasin